jgi:hypothetical protein
LRIKNTKANFPSLSYGRFGFFLRIKNTKAPDGINYPSEASNKPFGLASSHGKTPHRGYM